MREISPALYLSAEEYLRQVPSKIKEMVASIRTQKSAGTRPQPSDYFINNSKLLTPEFRSQLIDKVATLVDENLTGRSDMCEQSSTLIALALNKLGLPAKAVTGECLYFNKNIKLFAWRHSWVRVGDEIIDANVDILHENPAVPNSVKVFPYWGAVQNVPRDRKLRQNHGSTVAVDEDVLSIWWPDLDQWIDSLKMS